MVIVGDSLGSLLVYDSLCQSTSSNSNCSDDSSTLASTAATSLMNMAQAPSSGQNTTKSNMSVPSNLSRATTSKRQDDLVTSPIINLNDKTFLGSNETSKNSFIKKRNASSVSSSSGIEFSATPYLTPPTTGHLTQYMNSPLSEDKLEFDVTHFFAFGSPLGLVLAYRNLAFGYLDVPCCSQIYNLFHLTDPIAVRVEPLLCKQFRLIEPCMIPRHSKFPLGDGSNLSLGIY